MGGTEFQKSKWIFLLKQNIFKSIKIRRMTKNIKQQKVQIQQNKSILKIL